MQKLIFRKEHSMVILENQELESSVVTGESCIAVPIEVFEKSDGEVTVLSYSFCRDTAERFSAEFDGELFSEKARKWLDEKLDGKMRELGYEHYSHEGEMMLEYVLEDAARLSKPTVKAQPVNDNAELEKLCESTGCSIELNDDGEDILFAVVEDGIILSYAGMNDVVYDDRSVEISVETAPDRRREGLGFACVTALCEHILNKGKCVRYKCSVYNKASSALAEKCGFSLEGKRFSYICGRIEDN